MRRYKMLKNSKEKSCEDSCTLSVFLISLALGNSPNEHIDGSRNTVCFVYVQTILFISFIQP